MYLSLLSEEKGYGVVSARLFLTSGYVFSCYIEGYSSASLQPLFACTVRGDSAMVLSFFFAFAFQFVTNIANCWTSAATIKAYCDNTNAVNLGSVISDVLTDVMILIIPIPVVWKLQM